MRKYLLPEGKNTYKANLHCHTTMSDGQMSPEFMKKVYMEQGYSIIAYTDHEVLFPENHLTDESFLALNGVEYAVFEKTDIFDKTGKQIHFCAIALDENNHRTHFFREDHFMGGNVKSNLALMTAAEQTRGFKREYTPDRINEMLRILKEDGFFLTYNHPAWSLEDATVYGQYRGFDAAEIFNFGTYMIGFDSHASEAYDFMLKKGGCRYSLATDDNHHSLDHERVDCFGGFTVIFADSLTYPAITDALKKGDFYASTGPEIKALWLEGNILHVECSDAKYIQLGTGNRRAGVVESKNGVLLTSADFEVVPDKDGYVRVTVWDENGRFAHSNAHFFEKD